MANFEKQLLNYAQEGADGSGNSVGAHLMAKLAEGNADPKLIAEKIRQKNVRGGRGSKGEPSEIMKSIIGAQEEAVRIDSTLAKLKNEKEGLLHTIADFRVKERQLVETGRTEEVEAIRKAITNAQNEVDKINGVVPESVALDDHKKIQSIVSDWYTERQKAKEAAGKIMQAEKKLESTPDDGRALGDAIRGKTEKAEADEQLAQAEREAELVLKNKTPNPVRDEGVHHTNDETVKERNFLNRRHSERVAPGIFGHKKENEEMQNDMTELTTGSSEASVQQQGESATINETSVEEKNMKQELPPLEFTLEPTENENNLARVEERIKEVTARQAELEAEAKDPFQKSAVGEEIAELAKEMSSLEERRKGIEAKKPLQSAYDMAMDRIWKENEAKRNASPEKTKEETVVSAEITPEPEDDSLLPITTEGMEEVVGTPKEGQETAFEKFENIAEEKNVSKERALSMIASMRGTAEAEAEKRKMPEGWIRRVGETWNKVPTRYKLLLTVGMFASGLGSAYVGATTAVGALASIGAGLRAVGGAGLFVAIENGLKNRAEKKGDKRSGFGELRDTTIAATLSIIIIGVLPNMARDYAVEHGLFQKISEFFGFGDAHVEAPVKSGEYIQIAKSGDSVWKMAGNIVGEKYPDMSPEQKTYLIDAIKDRIEKYPGSYGLTDVNNITPGQGVDFGGIFGDKEFMDNTLSSAKNLTPEQITNIKNFDASPSAETPARTMNSEEFFNEPLHTTFTPEETTAPSVTEPATPTPEQVVLPAESYVAHTNAIVESEGLKGTFKYSENGALESFSMEGSSTATDGQKFLNENWREVARNNPGVGGQNMDINDVNASATTVSMFEQLLDTLEKKGSGATPEADFLRSSIEHTVNEAEKMHGDVFKNIEDFGKPEKIAVPPVEVKDVLMEGVIHEASEQTIPTSFIKPEILPGNTVELAYVMASADAIISKDMDILFGESKFLGFGHTNGIDSINWKDPQVGFGGKTVTEIMNSTPSAVPAEGGKTFGVQNYEATSKMKEYLSSVTHMTGVNPNSNEKVVDFIRRASVAKLSK